MVVHTPQPTLRPGWYWAVDGTENETDPGYQPVGPFATMAEAERGEAEAMRIYRSRRWARWGHEDWVVGYIIRARARARVKRDRAE